VQFKKAFGNQNLSYVLIAILAFAIVLVSVSSVTIVQMGYGDFYVESILPLPYWIAIAIITVAAFLMLRRLNGDKRSMLLFVFVTLILLFSFRIAFPAMFTSIPAFEPDSTNYMNIVNSWVNNGIDFSTAGHYEHDYPMAFLIAFAFVKLGVPLGVFFRVAPFVIYGLTLALIFLIISELTPDKKKLAAASVFLFSFSSLGYWVAVHYCPDLMGSMFFLVALFLGVRFAKKGEWSFKALAPVMACIVVLVLTHHLSTLYFILTMLGLALSTWYFKPEQFKGKALSFFILGIFTYTFWFAYGTLVYPDFFNVYSYFGGGFGSPTGLAQQAGWFNNFTFLIYPAFVIGLFVFELIRVFQIKAPRDLLKVRGKMRALRGNPSVDISVVFSLGFILVLGLFFVGFALPVSFPTRVLEVLCLGFYPLSSVTLLRFMEEKKSKKWLIILLIIVLLVVLLGVHRYYTQIQRRVLYG
jgi:hypothetical protein